MTTSAGRFSSTVTALSNSKSSRRRRPIAMPRAQPKTRDTVNAAATRASVIARFHGSAPDMVSRTIAARTAMNDGSNRLWARPAPTCQTSRNATAAASRAEEFARRYRNTG